MKYLLENSIHIDFIGNAPLLMGIGVQIISALFLGGLVGYDREVKMKAAGLKTNIMICIGATLYTTISLITVSNFSLGGAVDPNRIAAQIVSGIGFLGAGAIIQSKGSVTGLTTAATMWVVAAIGYTIGVGQIVTAIAFSLTVLLVLRLINPINKLIEQRGETANFHLEVLTLAPCLPTVKNFMQTEEVTILRMHEEVLSDTGLRVLNVFLAGHPRAIDRIANEISDTVKIKKVYHYEVHNIEEFLAEHNTEIQFPKP